MSTLSADVILDIFRRSGALLEGHFRLTSGLHSPGYLQCARVLQHPKEAEACGAAIADLVRTLDVDAVLSPALGGIVIGHEVARALGGTPPRRSGRPGGTPPRRSGRLGGTPGVRAVFAERQEGALTLRRGFTLEPGERVLVVEDVVTTGKSTRETIEVARAAGATVAGAASIIDRSGGQQGLDVPYFSLATVSLPTYEPGSCPLCAAGQPVVKPGSRS